MYDKEIRNEDNLNKLPAKYALTNVRHFEKMFGNGILQIFG